MVRINRMKDSARTITYEYDANGNVLKVTEESKEQKAEKLSKRRKNRICI